MTAQLEKIILPPSISLIVGDDVPNEARVTLESMKVEGANVHWFSSEKKILEFARNKKGCAMIDLDWHMEEYAGIEIAQKIKSASPYFIPLIFSAHTGNKFVKTCHNAGFQLLDKTKPVELRQAFKESLTQIVNTDSISSLYSIIIKEFKARVRDYNQETGFVRLECEELNNPANRFYHHVPKSRLDAIKEWEIGTPLMMQKIETGLGILYEFKEGKPDFYENTPEPDISPFEGSDSFMPNRNPIYF